MQGTQSASNASPNNQDGAKFIRGGVWGTASHKGVRRGPTCQLVCSGVRFGNGDTVQRHQTTSPNRLPTPSHPTPHLHTQPSGLRKLSFSSTDSRLLATQPPTVSCPPWSTLLIAKHHHGVVCRQLSPLFELLYVTSSKHV